MGLIKKSNEIAIQRNVKMMVYGQAGMGKTTLALSSPSALLLDFDNGVKRVNNAHLDDSIGIVQINNWQEVIQLLTQEQADLATFETIVVDTIGKMMDFIIAYRCNGRQPRVQDWGTINNDFKWFVSSLSQLNKHIIFVAHRDSRKEGDDTVFIPALREKNYNSIVTELDLLGYVEMKNENGVQKRTITFDPTSRNDGKNTCQLPGVMVIPNILDANGQPTSANDFIQKQIIAKYQGMIAVKEEAVKKYNEALEEIKGAIEIMTDAQGANHFLAHIGDYKDLGNSIIIYARDLFSKKVKSLGLVYNKETKQYEDAAAA
ncbi:MAG: ATP-binding protein [Bacteroidaceae bacterium]|nr:ATP-binding protein [Bacteroidaceae bacterium]